MAAVIRLMTGGDVNQARRRMRYAWVAAFIWVGIFLFNAGANALVWSGGQLAFVLGESTMVAILAFGVLKRRRPAAVLLFFYFAISRIVFIALGPIALQEPPDILRFLLIEAVVAYLLFQGIRGSLVFHYLTHPHYPTAATMPEAPTGKE